MTDKATDVSLEEGLENEPKPNQKAKDPLVTLSTTVEQGGEPTDKEGKRPKDNDNAEPEFKIKEEEVAIDDSAEAAKVFEQEFPSAALSEDIKGLLEAIDLPEDFKVKAHTLFEAAVVGRIADIKKDMFALNEAAMETYKAELKVKLEEKVSTYMEHATAKWLEENEVAVKYGLRTQIAESFMTGLHALLEAHNIAVPEGKEDILEAANEKVIKLESALAEEVNKNIALVEAAKLATKSAVLESAVRDLTDVQADRVKELVTSIVFESEESYAEKVKTIIEGITVVTKPSDFLTEDANGATQIAVEQPTKDPKELSLVEAFAQDMAKYL